MLTLARKCAHCAHVQMSNEFLRLAEVSGLEQWSETIAVNVHSPNNYIG